ncbi:serine/threonine-protein kinase [Candidatus Uabimicrobium amorphum]|uniref:non-specific serine/threonine protein kinase n=1 Tax=Uabimicrobium amorphum TaxID=2596890 RepID=A0A5S9IHP0_UABAM|nr:serine/threonine-protein kinase [Candidatus Uabimicrobium amorphum]BBM81854.1 hypothetical protein UABAM_00195 [Candidatus Uabimicrobium amorphum]
MSNIRKLKELYNKYTVDHNWKKSVEIINKIIEQEPKNAKFIMRRGMLYYKQKMWKKAQEDIARALELDKTLKQAYQIQSSISRKLKNKTVFSEDVTLEELLVPNERILVTPRKIVRQTKKQIGRYVVKEEIGRGGMGKVYKVFDPKLDRNVALKVLLEGSESHPQRVQRFLREAKATAKLHHPNIVALHDINHEKNFVFFTMDFINGETLKSYAARTNPSFKEIIHITITIAQAIHYAHQEGIVHRDLKPTNVMVAKTGEVKVMDFGLAKIVHSNDDLSRTGDSMGTPAYMSPEQANGSKVDVRTDVYSLGAILYQLLVEHPPFVGENHYNILFQVLNRDPILPRRLNPDIPVELEAICLKCLEKKPEKRYKTAQQFAEDLQNFIHNRPIIAKPATVTTLAVKFIRRHRTLTVTTLLVLISIILGAWSTYIQWEKTLAEKTKAQQDRRNTVFRLAKITLAKAKEYLRSQDEQQKWQKCGAMASTAIEMVKEYSGEDKQKIVGEAQDLVRVALQRNGILWETNYFGVAPVREEYSSSKTTDYEEASLQVAFCGENILCGRWDGNISFYGRYTGKKLHQITAHHKDIEHLVSHPNQPIFAFAANDDQISLWHAQKQSAITLLVLNDFVSSLAISPDGQWIAAGGKNGSCQIWHMSSHKKVAQFAYSKKVSAATFDPHNQYLVTAVENRIHLANIDQQKLQKQIVGHDAFITSLHFHHSGKMLVSAAQDEIHLWSFPQMEKRHTWKTRSSVKKLIFSHQNDFFVCACDNGEILVYDTSSRGLHHILQSGKMPVSSIDISDDDKHLLSASLANDIQLWNLKTGKALHEKNGHTNTIAQVVFHPKGKLLASSSYDGTVRILDSFSGESIIVLAHNSYVYSCAFSPNGKLLATVTDKKIHIWNWQQKKILYTLKQESPTSVAFNFDNSLVASSSQNGNIDVWHLSSGKKYKTIRLHKDIVWDIDFHPNNNTIASVSEDRSMRIWDLENDKEIRKVEYSLESFAFVSVKFSPQGDKVAYGGESKSIFVYDVSGKENISEISGHLGSINDVTFDATGNFIASCSDDQSIRVWSVHDKVQLHRFSSYAWINSIDFHPQQNKIISGDQQGIVKMWDLPYMQQHRQALSTLGVFLCPTENSNIYAMLQELRTVSLYDATKSTIKKLFTSPIEAYGMSYSRDGRFVALANIDNCVRIFDTQQQKISRTLKGHDAPVWSVAFSPNGKFLASSSKDRSIILWDISTGKQLRRLQGHQLSIYRIVFSPDSKLLASASEDRSVKIWDVNTGEILENIDEKDRITIYVLFSPDGKKLAYSASKNAYIWDLEKRTKKVLRGHQGFLTDIAFSKDSKILASSSYDKTIRLWNAQTGILENEIKGHLHTVMSIIFPSHKPIIISMGEDKTIRHWRLQQTKHRAVVQVPLYLRDIIATTTYIPPTQRSFIHHNISADVILQALQNPHHNLTKELFQFRVGETLQLEYQQRTAWLWNKPFAFDKTLRDKYLQQAHKYAPQHPQLAVDCLEVSLRIDPAIVPQIRLQFPKLCAILSERYANIAERMASKDNAKHYYEIALLIDESNQKAQAILRKMK